LQHKHLRKWLPEISYLKVQSIIQYFIVVVGLVLYSRKCMNRKKTSLTDFLNIGIKVTFEYNQYYNTGYIILKYLIAVVRLVFYSKKYRNREN